MATTTRGYNFSTTETVTAAKLHALVDSATVTGIVDSDVAAGAAIASTKIAQDLSGYATIDTTQTITGDKTYTGTTVFNPTLPDSNLSKIVTAGKVGGAAITELGSVPAGSTALPLTSGGTGQVTAQAAIDALTAVSSATNEHVLTKDTTTGNAIFKAPPVSFTNVYVADASKETLIGQANTIRVTNSSYPTMSMVKEFLSNGSGSIYFSWMAHGDGARGARVQVYKNDSAVGTARISTSSATVYTEYNDTVAGFVSGDLIQIYMGTEDGTHQAYIKDVKLYATGMTVNTD
jgi:hypothetical protein